MSIREATEKDAAPLANLAERTFRDTFANMNRSEDMEAHCRSTYGAGIQAFGPWTGIDLLKLPPILAPTAQLTWILLISA